MRSVYFKTEGLTEDQIEKLHDIMVESGGEVCSTPEAAVYYVYYGIDEWGDIIALDRAGGFFEDKGVEVEPTPEALRQALDLTQKAYAPSQLRPACAGEFFSRKFRDNFEYDNGALALLLDIPEESFEDFLAGRGFTITDNTARKIAALTDTNYEFWVNIRNNYLKWVQGGGK